MSKIKPKPYGMVPSGCRFSVNITANMVAVDLDDLAVQGTRAQRRFAVRELRKLKNKSGGKHGD